MDMVVEAIDNLAEPRGSSVQAIKSYILQNFKTVRVDMIKSMLRRALRMGLQQSILARPKGQTETQVGLQNTNEGEKGRGELVEEGTKRQGWTYPVVVGKPGIVLDGLGDWKMTQGLVVARERLTMWGFEIKQRHTRVKRGNFRYKCGFLKSCMRKKWSWIG